MKKKIFVLLFVITTMLTGCNLNNSIEDEVAAENAISWFEDTGIIVKDSRSKIYRILTLPYAKA